MGLRMGGTSTWAHAIGWWRDPPEPLLTPGLPWLPRLQAGSFTGTHCLTLNATRVGLPENHGSPNSQTQGESPGVFCDVTCEGDMTSEHT